MPLGGIYMQHFLQVNLDAWGPGWTRLTNSRSKFIYKDLPLDDPTKRQPDIRKAMEMLDWRPRVKLEEGLKRTIEWFKKNNKH